MAQCPDEVTQVRCVIRHSWGERGGRVRTKRERRGERGAKGENRLIKSEMRERETDRDRERERHRDLRRYNLH